MWNFVNRLFNREQQKPAAEADPSIYKQQPWDLWAEDPQAAFEQAKEPRQNNLSNFVD